MSVNQDNTRGERRDDVHGKRLAELVRNALRKRLGKKKR